MNFRKLFKKDQPTSTQEVIDNKEEIKEIDSVDPIIQKDKPVGLKSRLSEITQKLDVLTQKDKGKDKEHRDFRLPSSIKRQLKKLALKNKLMVIYLTRNRGMIPMVTTIIDGFINIEGVPHNCSPDFIFLWKGKYPAIVLPEWDINPIGTKDYYDAVTADRVADPIAIAIRMIENKENIMKKQISPKLLIGILIGAAIVGYVLFSGG